MNILEIENRFNSLIKMFLKIKRIDFRVLKNENKKTKNHKKNQNPQIKKKKKIIIFSFFKAKQLKLKCFKQINSIQTYLKRVF